MGGVGGGAGTLVVLWLLTAVGALGAAKSWVSILAFGGAWHKSKVDIWGPRTNPNPGQSGHGGLLIGDAAPADGARLAQASDHFRHALCAPATRPSTLVPTEQCILAQVL